MRQQMYIPTTNNQLEGYNSHIKNNELARAQLNIKDCLKFTLDLIRCESRRRDPSYKDSIQYSG